MYYISKGNVLKTKKISNVNKYLSNSQTSLKIASLLLIVKIVFGEGFKFLRLFHYELQQNRHYWKSFSVKWLVFSRFFFRFFSWNVLIKKISKNYFLKVPSTPSLLLKTFFYIKNLSTYSTRNHVHKNKKKHIIVKSIHSLAPARS